MISTLLRKNISAWQLAAYSVACLVGLSILLISINFYADIRSAQSQDRQPGNYIVLSKPVSLLAALGGSPSASNSFSPAEIEDLASQPWVRRIGEFTSADFNISAAVEFAGRGLSTALFFESLPDEFVDTDLDQWHFDPASKEIPILVPQDYLALYNYGFAASRGMPQLSESLIKQIPIRIAVAGNGHYDVFPARIAGLSSRLNTIAVPDSFMTWANSYYGDKNDVRQPARLIVELSSPGDPAAARWISDNNLDSSDNNAASGKAVYLASVVSAVVGTIGVVIAALSVLILLLSMFLLVQKNSGKIRDLTLLGYRRSQVAAFYDRLIIIINCAVTTGAIITCILVSRLWTGILKEFGVDGNNTILIVLAAAAIMGAVTVISVASCRKMIKKASR